MIMSGFNFGPGSRCCARCMYWGGTRRVQPMGNGVLVIASIDRRDGGTCARQYGSTTVFKANEGCGSFKPAFGS
jgi:hypothetical protein